MIFQDAARKGNTMKRAARSIKAVLFLIAGSAALLGFVGQRSVGAGNQATENDGLRARVEKRVQAWQPTKEERRLDEIGWAKDIRDAFSLARQHHRPIFFFSYDGTTDRPQAMATQRC
jgi:hypothetical protein